MSNNITGYHGTNKSNFASIKANGYQLIDYGVDQKRIANDLGDGFYFFGTNSSHKGFDSALNYVKLFRNQGSNHASILEYELCYEDNEILDLDDPSTQKQLLIHMKQMKNHIDRMIKVDKGNNRVNYDGMFINIFLKNYSNIKIVKKETFTPVRCKGERSNFPNGLEYCVKSHCNYKFVKNKDIKI